MCVTFFLSHVLPSPVNLVRWKVQEDDKCRCGKRGTMKHILSNCHMALNRYTWRHNEVLKVLTKAAEEHVKDRKYAPRLQRLRLGKVKFVPQGSKGLTERALEQVKMRKN